MSKKRILNATSVKKRNTMLSFSNTTTSGASQTNAVGGAYVNGNATGIFVFCPTAMDLNSDTGAPNLRINQAQRTATTCYMRGFAENLRIQTSSGLPWFHRRICFTSKGETFAVSTGDASATQLYNPFIETSNGFQRLMFNLNVNNSPQTIAAMWNVLFRGAQGVDWNDIILAPLDTSRVTVKFDKTWTIRSGNANGTVAERKLWHGMNKNIVYDDDESGAGETTAKFSVDSKAGMGDYYVIDIISPGSGGTPSDQLLIVPNSTLYWHEK